MLAANGVELELAALRQSLALIRCRLRSSARPDGWARKPIRAKNPEQKKREALFLRDFQAALMFARERSTRGQMRLPSLAQRGEGRAGGWEWGVGPTEEGKLNCSEMLQRILKAA